MFSSNLRVFAVTLLVLVSDVMERLPVPLRFTCAVVLLPILREVVVPVPIFTVGEVIFVSSDCKVVILLPTSLPMVIPVVVSLTPIPIDLDVIVVELPAREIEVSALEVSTLRVGVSPLSTLKTLSFT